jgi:hypothetical protein
MSEEQEAYRYDKMVEQALRGVVKTALEEVMEKGLFDEHHFYITFRTDFKGVQIPDYLKDRYPGEMTIVLQHQFFDLDVDTEKFTVMLKFNNVPERLQIPLAAITIFTDPSVNFALQFQPLTEDEGLEDGSYDDEELELDDEDTSGEVISLDQFRAKGNKAKPKKKSAADDDDDTDSSASDDDEDRQDDAKAKKSQKSDSKDDADRERGKKTDKNNGKHSDQNNDKNKDD